MTLPGAFTHHLSIVKRRVRSAGWDLGTKDCQHDGELADI